MRVINMVHIDCFDGHCPAVLLNTINRLRFSSQQTSHICKPKFAHLECFMGIVLKIKTTHQSLSYLTHLECFIEIVLENKTIYQNFFNTINWMCILQQT